MFSLPPYVLLVPFALFMAFFLFFSLANIFSLSKYGARNMVGLTVSFIFVSGSAIILFFTWQSIGIVDWTTPVQVIGAIQPAF